MKLAEALAERHDAQTRLQQLMGRISENALVQEGDEPDENVKALVKEAVSVQSRVAELVERVNRTNSTATLADGRTITAALAERDRLLGLQRIYSHAASAGNRGQGARFLRTELRMVSLVDVAEMRRLGDQAAKDYRVLDALVQQANWNVDLLE